MARAPELAIVFDGVSGDAQDDIARLHAGARRGAVLLHRRNQRAAWPVKSEGLGELCVQVLDGDADATAHDAAGFDDLLLDILRHVDRNRERQAHEAAGAAEDLRVDADHLARHVEKRPAGVTRIHGHVGLDERHVVLALQRARRGADDAGGNAVVEAKRRADREHPLAGLDARRIAQARWSSWSR